jgi:ribonuclease HI
MSTFTMQFDGGSRGNPGCGGAGAVIFSGPIDEPDAEIWSGSFFLGQDITNNQAEYTGLIEGLKAGQTLNIPKMHVQGDSELVLKQMKGEYKVRNPGLQRLYREAMTVVKQYPKNAITFEHIARAFNKRADELSNVGMDEGKNKAQDSAKALSRSQQEKDSAEIISLQEKIIVAEKRIEVLRKGVE